MPTENSKVLVVLDRPVLEAMLTPVADADLNLVAAGNQALATALDAEQEERREGRVVGERAGAPTDRLRVLFGPSYALGAVASQANPSYHPNYENVRQQVRTITQLQDGQFISGWRDLEEGE